MDDLVMTISATTRETRLRLMHGPDEVMRARLRPVVASMHPRAVPMLFESMALWHDQRLRAVASVESEDFLFAMGLCDGLGLGRATMHYTVEPLLVGESRRRGRRLGCLGSGFGSLAR